MIAASIAISGVIGQPSASAAVDVRSLLRAQRAPVVWYGPAAAPGDHDRVFTTTPAAVAAILRDAAAPTSIEEVPVEPIPHEPGPLTPRPPLGRRLPGAAYSATRRTLTLPSATPTNPGQLWVELQRWDGASWSAAGSTLAPRVPDADRCPTVWWHALPSGLSIPTTDEGYTDRPAEYRLWLPDLARGWYRFRVSLFSRGRAEPLTIATFRRG